MAREKLTKAHLVDKVYQDPAVDELKLTRKQIMTVVSVFVEKLRESIEGLGEDDRIELRGFGTFGVKKRKARVARNPKTGEEVKVPSRKTPFFKPGKELKNSVK
ncbi:HU family DNA-binding protein [Thermospira aquatica]|uniref:Integration host factor subunit beta n=1 Tax=Thermospira aquatica TaxID=2828656 RepID=A0AAX3BCI9_9SPIR|nr:HU family DNA-binding protein [Thermospira aquatica]URA09851.1 integration host factor subunit beta [Thermospira aquatica]